MSRSFNEEMAAQNERARRAQQRPAQARPPEPAAAPVAQEDAPAPRAATPADPGLSRTGRRVRAGAVAVAALAILGPALGGLVDSPDPGYPVMIDPEPAAIVTYDTGDFLFDAPADWVVEDGVGPDPVRLWTSQGDLVELVGMPDGETAGAGGGDAYAVATAVYTERIGFEADGLAGVALGTPSEDPPMIVSGTAGAVAVPTETDGPAWASVYHQDSGLVDPRWGEVLLPSVIRR